ncbi:TlpA disulfide reductase family protein [Sphingobacterium thalpophilum]|uniref:TlpA disulfide reductase family protein n=1 Tax=Sphingobacterium thalpophilum TaxID=259 RepID=A0ACD5C8E1_9SPHI
MTHFYKGGSELPIVKDFSHLNQVKSEKNKIQFSDLPTNFHMHFISIFQVLIKYYLSTDIVLLTQLLRKKIGQGKTYFKGTSVLLKKRCKISTQNLIKEADSSGSLRLLFEDRSTLRRTNVASSSGTLRLLFDCASGSSRTTVEALPKLSRRSAKPVSNMSRRSLEAEPKASRRGEEVSPSTVFCLTNFAPASAFHAIGIEFSSGFHRATPIKTGCRPDENPMKRRNSVVIGYLTVDYTFAQETHKLDYSATLGSPLLSPCYTQGQLNDCTSPTQQKQAFQQVGESRLTYGVESERSVLRFFKSICKALLFRANTLLGLLGPVVQRALKWLLFVADYKRAYRMIMTCLCLCFVSMFSLSAQTPRKDSGADGLDKIKGLQVGDRLPDKFWSTSYLGLKDGNTAEFNFHQSKGKFILLDFWATWCTVCVKGFPKIDSLHRALKDNIAIVLVNQKGNRDTKESVAAFFERYHNRFPYAMDMPQIYQDTILNQYFQHRSIPHYVLISPQGRVLSLGSIREFKAMIEILNLSFYKNSAKALKERRTK